MHSRYRWPGGEESTVERLAESLRAAGHKILGHQIPNPTSPHKAAASVVVSPWNPRSYLKVRELIENFKPDIAHVHNTWFALSPSVISACVSRSLPVVITVHNYRSVCPQAHLYRNGGPCTDCVGRSALPGLRHRCYRGSVALTAANAATTSLSAALGVWSSIKSVHVPAEFTKRVLAMGPLANAHFEVFPNAVSDPGPRRRLPSTSNVVLFVGRLSDEKGLDLVLDAWRRSRPPNMVLRVIGDGPKRELWSRGAPPGVVFEGSATHDAVRAAMLEARALVFPSRSYEVCPMVIVEAFAAGLPVLAHELGATAELLAHSTCNTLVPFGLDSGWNAALDLVATGSSLDEIGVENRHAYQQLHTLGSWVTSHEDMYNRALIG